MSTETWRAVEGWAGRYEVSDLGRVRRLYKTRDPRILVERAHPTRGYSVVDFSLDWRKSVVKVHLLVAAAFLGLRPDGLVTRHLSDEKSDNRAANLAYGTAAENAQDAIRNGRNAAQRKTQCPAGHPYDEANTARVGNRRHCRACHRRHQLAYTARKKAA